MTVILRAVQQPVYDTERFNGTAETSAIRFFLDPVVELMRQKLKPGRFSDWLRRYRRKLKRRDRSARVFVQSWEDSREPFS